LDLTSLVIMAGLFLGLVVGDAALFRDPVQLQISVPSKLAEGGLTETAAEYVFSAQVAEMGQAVSFVPTPSVQISARPTILAALAKPLNLDNVVVAIQSQAGVDVVTVRGVIVAAASGNGLDMVTMVTRPREPAAQVRLSQEDGDATVLIQRSAEWAMELVSPYRLALTQFAHGLKSDPALLKRAKDIATRAVSQTWVPSRATEQVMLHNLLATVALLDGDIAEVHAQFRLTDPIPGALPASHGVIEANRSFLALVEGQPTEAERHYRAAMTKTEGLARLRGWEAKMNTLGALVAWANGNVARAEAMLRTAEAEMPEEETQHAYLARLLESQGDKAGAAAERTAAANDRRFETDFPALPQSLFWVDPVHGGMQRRS
jgi:hypothetical protein